MLVLSLINQYVFMEGRLGWVSSIYFSIFLLSNPIFENPLKLVDCEIYKNFSSKPLSFQATFVNVKISCKSAMAWFDTFPLAATFAQNVKFCAFLFEIVRKVIICGNIL